MDRTSLIALIRFQLSRLKVQNRHHDFEALALAFARARVAANLMPATGPVSAAGDQGRDFESFRTSTNQRPSSIPFARAAADEDIVGACTTADTKSLVAKITSDLEKILSRHPQPTRILYFCSEDVVVSKRHELEEYYRTARNVELTIFDGECLSEHLADKDIFWIAVEFLNIAPESHPERRAGQGGGAARDELTETLPADGVDGIPIHPEFMIESIRYGDAPQVVNVPRSSLFVLPKKARIQDAGSFMYRPAKLIPPNIADIATHFRGKTVYFPRSFAVAVKKPESYASSPVRLFACTDLPHPQHAPSVDALTFEVKLGLGGIVAFVDSDGNVRQRDRCTVGEGLGTAGVLVAVAFTPDGPQIRTPYVLVIRKGIRYPDDVWLSAKTARPFTSRPSELDKVRFAFQSRQSGALGTAIFAADYQGTRMYNITEQLKYCANQIRNDRGEEVLRWTADGKVAFASNFRGTGILEEVILLDRPD